MLHCQCEKIYVEPKKGFYCRDELRKLKFTNNIPFKWKVNIFVIIPKYGGGQKG